MMNRPCAGDVQADQVHPDRLAAAVSAAREPLRLSCGLQPGIRDRYSPVSMKFSRATADDAAQSRSHGLRR